jgi:hypothetical protein
MKRLLSLVVVVLLGGTGISFAAPFDQFNNSISGVAADIAQQNINNFAKDLGVMMGGVSYHSGESLGFPGFDVGIHVPAAKVSSDNAIVKAAGLDTVYLPLLQAEIGLPAKFDIIGRFSAYENSTLVGAGLRYGLFKSTLPGIPSLSVQGVYNALNVNYGAAKFTANTITASAVTSIELPVVVPYLGITYAQTAVEPDASISLPKPGLKGEATGIIIEGGVNLALFPLTYLQLGASLAEGNFGYSVGLGVKY